MRKRERAQKMERKAIDLLVGCAIIGIERSENTNKQRIRLLKFGKIFWSSKNCSRSFL